MYRLLLFIFLLFEFDLNAVKYTWQLAIEYPPGPWQVPGLIESTEHTGTFRLATQAVTFLPSKNFTKCLQFSCVVKPV